jgi:hypothetical protein
MTTIETTPDFKARIALIMRQRETGKRYSVLGAPRTQGCVLRKATDRGYYPPAKKGKDQ